MDGGLGCLPPTYWLDTGGAVSASDMTPSAAQLVLVQDPYEDALVVTDFGISLPDDFTVTGIEFDVRRASLAGFADDDVIQVLQNGMPVGTNHAQNDGWPMTLAYAHYGGVMDTWGVSWTPADLRASGFGISVTPKYTGPAAGNERGYVDSVRVTVYFKTPCP
jgi:hypothetical protein